MVGERLRLELVLVAKSNENEKRVCSQNPFADASRAALQRFDRLAVGILFDTLKNEFFQVLLFKPEIETYVLFEILVSIYLL